MTELSDVALDRHLDGAADRLWASRDALVEAQLKALQAFPAYAAVPRPELELSCERNVARVVSVLRGEDALPAEIVEDERRSGARRARQGIPAEVVVEAYRAVIGIIRDDFLQASAALDVPTEAMLAGIRRLWVLTDHFSSALVAARHVVEIDAARAAEEHRVAFVRLALDPVADPERVMEEGRPLGIAADATYWVVVAHQGGAGAEAVRRALARAGQPDTAADLVVAHHLGFEGITASRPSIPDDLDCTVAVAGPVLPADLGGAASECRRVLHAALASGFRGVVDRDRLGLHLAVAEDEELGALLRARHVDPVTRASPMAEDVLRTVEAYLDLRSVAAAAQELSVHVNTVRYRLEKFAELTGSDLARTVTAFEVWWALRSCRSA